MFRKAHTVSKYASKHKVSFKNRQLMFLSERKLEYVFTRPRKSMNVLKYVASKNFQKAGKYLSTKKTKLLQGQDSRDLSHFSYSAKLSRS